MERNPYTPLFLERVRKLLISKGFLSTLCSRRDKSEGSVSRNAGASERLVGGGLLTITGHLPLFFVSVASKGLTTSLSLLFATHTRVRASGASKGFAVHQSCAKRVLAVTVVI